ncbi:MAG: hypothetical protein KC503_13445 [Myxococcales bacterium]|nr:hypothetical protein [Myxococcales bacterium]
MSSTENYEKWLAIVLAAALDHDILQPDDVLRYVTPEVLASHLPPDVMSNVLAASLTAGQMTAEVILRTAGPGVLSRYVPPDILWSAVREASRRAEIPA